MKKSIRILHLEDEETIVKVVRSILQKDGLIVESIQVQTKTEFSEALEQYDIDLIIADYSLPKYNGLDALRLLRQQDSEMPFILFSGSIGEEKAIASLREGATDYVLKENITALGPVVTRALNESMLNREVKKSEQALKDSANRYRSLFEGAPDGVQLINKQGIIIDCNEAEELLTGYTRVELLDKLFANFMSEKSKLVFKTNFSSLQKEGSSDGEIELIRKDGLIIPVWSKAKAIYDVQGHFNGAVIYNRDISKQREAEDSIQSLGRIFDDSLNEIYIFDANTLRALRLNRGAKEKMGYTEAECSDLTIINVIPGFSRENFENLVKPLREGKVKKLNLTTKHQRKDGSQYPVDSLLQLSTYEGKPAFIAIASDITERLRAEKIRQVMFEISMAHLKTPTEMEFFILIQKQLSALLDTSNFIIAMYDSLTDTLAVKYMQDKMDSIEEFGSIPAKDTLSAYVITNQKPLLLNEGDMESFFNKHKIKWVGTPAKCWLGVPLVLDKISIGLMIVQSYEQSDRYNEDDAQLMEFVAGQLAESIKRIQIEDKMYQLSRSVEQSPISIVITDLDGTIQYVNPKFCQVTGYTKEEALGQNPRILKSGETLAEGYAKLWSTIKRGKVWRGRFHNKKKNGLLFWEDATIGPIQNDQGEATHFLALKEDISERVETEESIKRLNQQNETLVAAFPSILMVMNAEEQVIRWNHKAAEVFKLNWKQVRHQQLHGLPIDWDWGAVVDGISMCRDQKKIIRLTDISFERSDGVNGFLNMSIAPFTDEESILDGYLIHAEDITEKKIAEGQKAQTQKLESIGQLAAGIAHEINTPTQYIGDNTHFLKDSFEDIGKLLKVFREIQSSAEEVKNLTEYVKKIGSIAEEIDLDFLIEEIPEAIEQSLDGIGKVSKIVKAMKEFSHPGSRDKTLVDLNRAIQNTITVSRNEWKYVADVETEFDETLTEVPCFHDEFNQVILNIIINAAHAIGDTIQEGDSKGTITIQTFHRGQNAEIRIKDTGTGIPESIIKKIFDPFFTTKEVGKGTGQGLAISYDVIVNKHKGTLEVESEPGRGTVFIIQLPLNN